MNYNITNGGLICIAKDQWLVSDLYRYETGTPQYIGGMFWFMNLVGDQVYYSDQLRNHLLCQYDLLHQRSTVIVDHPCYGVLYQEDRLYYIRERDQTVYGCDLAGRNSIQINQERTTSFIIAAEKMIYATPKGIYQCSIKGKATQRLTETESSFILLLGEYLFFNDVRRGCLAQRLHLATNVQEPIPEMSAMTANTDGAYVYYPHCGDENNIYRFDPRTDTHIRMCRDRADYIHLFGNDLLYYNHKEWKKMSLFGGTAKNFWGD